jgi:hypothetical protein
MNVASDKGRAKIIEQETGKVPARTSIPTMFNIKGRAGTQLVPHEGEMADINTCS